MKTIGKIIKLGQLQIYHKTKNGIPFISRFENWVLTGVIMGRLKPTTPTPKSSLPLLNIISLDLAAKPEVIKATPAKVKHDFDFL
ncbi:hypothetical protein [Sporisorium scitamineum]|uniref:Uncharacterized protein n=1 Tax=Sporisorium scitamineum TaxID=49012 RepID=A0A0F7S611_9BASI|nr:hypothetical protein [Sporisorium scitamineum]